MAKINDIIDSTNWTPKKSKNFVRNIEVLIHSPSLIIIASTFLIFPFFAKHETKNKHIIADIIGGYFFLNNLFFYCYFFCFCLKKRTTPPLDIKNANKSASATQMITLRADNSKDNFLLQTEIEESNIIETDASLVSKKIVTDYVSIIKDSKSSATLYLACGRALITSLAIISLIYAIIAKEKKQYVYSTIGLTASATTCLCCLIHLVRNEAQASLSEDQQKMLNEKSGFFNNLIQISRASLWLPIKTASTIMKICAEKDRTEVVTSNTRYGAC